MSRTNKQIIKEFLNDYYRYQHNLGGLQDKLSIENVLKLQYDILADNLFYMDETPLKQ